MLEHRKPIWGCFYTMNYIKIVLSCLNGVSSQRHILCPITLSVINNCFLQKWQESDWNRQIQSISRKPVHIYWICSVRSVFSLLRRQQSGLQEPRQSYVRLWKRLCPWGCEESGTTEQLRVRALEALKSAHCLQVESMCSPGAHLTGFSLRRMTLHIACCTLKIIVSCLKTWFWKKVNSGPWNSFMARSEVTCSTLTMLHCGGGRAVSYILAACSLEIFSLHLLNT